MRLTIIAITLAFVALMAAGCVTKGEEQGPAGEQASEDIIPFGLKLNYNVETIFKNEPQWKDLKYDDYRFPKYGITVKAVLSGRQADKMGFQAGDIIYAINDKTFEDTAEFIHILYRLNPGEMITFRIVREEGSGHVIKEINMVIPTYGYVDYDFPVIFGYHNNDYIRRAHVFLVLYHKKQLFGAQTAGMFPFYYRERLGNVSTHRILWFFKWRTGVEDEIII